MIQVDQPMSQTTVVLATIQVQVMIQAAILVVVTNNRGVLDVVRKIEDRNQAVYAGQKSP